MVCSGRRAAVPPAPETTAPRQLELVWADEFDRDGRPDSSKWTYEHGFVRNEELQWNRPENARAEHGQLIIEARRERVRNPAFDSTINDWRAPRPHPAHTSSTLTTQRPARGEHRRLPTPARPPGRPPPAPSVW